MASDKLLILGMGLQGTGALEDVLSRKTFSDITVADYGKAFEEKSEYYKSLGVKPVSVDASDLDAVREVIKDKDVVIELLPFDYATKVGRIAAECGVNLVSSMYYIAQSVKDSEQLQKDKKNVEEIGKLATQNNCTILIAFGMDPGLDLMLGADLLKEVDEVDTFNSYGGGFPAPEFANNPLRYKFSWSPRTTLSSYARNIKRIVGGKVIDILAAELFAKENIHILKDPILGYDVECYSTGNCENFASMFNLTGKVQNMDRYSCRLPGHCDFWHKMVNCGFLSQETISVQGQDVSPFELVASLLQSQKQFWFAKDERDVCLIRTEVKGKKNGIEKHVAYTIVDHKDLGTGLTAMQRTVGYTISIAAKLISTGKINKKGILMPMDIPLEFMKDELAKRNIVITKTDLLKK